MATGMVNVVAIENTLMIHYWQCIWIQRVAGHFVHWITLHAHQYSNTNDCRPLVQSLIVNYHSAIMGFVQINELCPKMCYENQNTVVAIRFVELLMLLLNINSI